MFFSELGQNIDLHFGSMVMLPTKSLIAVVANKTSNWAFSDLFLHESLKNMPSIINLSILTAVFALQLCELSFQKTHHLRNPYNDNLPVKVCGSPCLVRLLVLAPWNMAYVFFMLKIGKVWKLSIQGVFSSPLLEFWKGIFLYLKY